MTNDDWPLWGDPGDLIRADPTGHVRRTFRASINETWALISRMCGIPPLDLDHLLEGL